MVTRLSILGVVFLTAVAALGADEPLTTAKLSETLTANCGKLKEAFTKKVVQTTPNDCKVGVKPTKEQLTACRTALASLSTAAIADKAVTDELATQGSQIRASLAHDTNAIQRLHLILPGRHAELTQAVTTAATEAWADFGPKNDTEKLEDIASPAKIGEVTKTIGDKLFHACLTSDPAVIDAAFPPPASFASRTESAVRDAEEIIDEFERKAFADFTKAEGFSRTVECVWATKTENARTHGALACKPGLLVSGEEVSEIRVIGVPAGQRVRVLAIHAEELAQTTTCPPGDNLTCDQLTIPADSPRPISIAVHTMRWVSPSFGGMLGNADNAVKYLRTPAPRTKLSLVNDGTPPTIAVGVQVGPHFAAAFVPVGYARWKIESGGFLSVSNQVDFEAVTKAVDGSTPAKVTVETVREADNVVQDSGIFVNFIPQNYQAIGVSLGLATPSNRRLSIYLGPTVRVRTFGNRGLASLAFGLAMRSVLRFPDITQKMVDEKTPVTADSKILEGREQFRFGWFAAVNLGFRIGAFGPSEGGDE
jgi:hypothetical protein